MPGPNSDNVVVGANGSLSFAPVGSPLPANVDDDLNAAFSEFGFLNEDGVKTKDGKTIEDVMAWQSIYAIRKIVTEREFSIAFTCQEFTSTTAQLALGGGTVTETSPGLFKYTPPDPSELDERAAVVEWSDADKIYRLCLPRGFNQEGVEFDVTRKTNVGLPITFTVIGQNIVEGDDSSLPWFILTNDPAWAEDAGS